MSLCNYTELFPTCEKKNFLAIIKGITTSSLKLISYTSMLTHTLILIMWVEPFNNVLFYFFNLFFHLPVGALSACPSMHHTHAVLAKAGRGFEFSGTDLQTALSCHVGAGDQTRSSRRRARVLYY